MKLLTVLSVMVAVAAIVFMVFTFLVSGSQADDDLLGDKQYEEQPEL